MSLEQNDWELVKVGIQAAGYVIGWIIVVVGWIVSQKQNKSRDERKDLRDRVNDISDKIRTLEADVVAYIADTDAATRAAGFWTVQFGVQSVNAAVVISAQFKTSEVEVALINYRKAITGQALDGPDSPLKAPADRDKALRQVSKCGNALVRALETRFVTIYKPKKHSL